jgi:4-hydroxythreonine-4-phosphate dehydrogenase
MPDKMLLAVSMGDPSGIGIEIALKAWADGRHQLPPFFIVGKAEIFRENAKKLGINANIANISKPSEAADIFANTLPVYEIDGAVFEYEFGKPNSDNAEIIIKSIKTACELAIAGEVSGIVTLPIAKSVLYAAGFKFPGHTEYIAHLCSEHYNINHEAIMMLSVDGLRVALVTIHDPIAKVPELITTEKIITLARAINKSMQTDFGINAPKIALLGLNPHAGEDGAIGREELEIINPAAAQLRAEGIDITNALPADTAFADFNRDQYDIYLAMYHDQGLIPIKALDFHGGVNTSLNLPIIRTSPDHGTGFGIAGKDIARYDSFVNALKMAQTIANNRKIIS